MRMFPRPAAGRGVLCALLQVAIVALTLLAGIGITSASDGPTLDTLTITTVSGDHRFMVERAVTPEEREVGLMNRPEMAADHGMIFRFEETRPVMMWMKSTLIPLDMIFIREDGTVAGIKERATPLSLSIIASPEPVRYVLEVVGGTARSIGARPGDRVSTPLIDETRKGG